MQYYNIEIRREARQKMKNSVPRIFYNGYQCLEKEFTTFLTVKVQERENGIPKGACLIT